VGLEASGFIRACLFRKPGDVAFEEAPRVSQIKGVDDTPQEFFFALSITDGNLL
jgi:hypothetical protein